MVWRNVENDVIVAIYQRDPVIMPSSEETFEDLKGSWAGIDGVSALRLDDSRLVIVMPDGKEIDTYFELNGKLLAFNYGTSGPVTYAVNFQPNGTMTLTKPFTNEELAFIR